MLWLNICLLVLASIIGLIILVFLCVAVIGLYNKCTIVKSNSNGRLDNKTAIVTGGTRGIGLEIAMECARRGAKVIIACPFQEEGTNARNNIVRKTGNDKITFKMLNLASLESVHDFVNDILKTEDRLDILVNNAGVLTPDKLTGDGMNFVMQINYFGHFLLTLLLLPLLKKTGQPSDKSRIVNISSLTHSKGSIDINNLNKTGYQLNFMAYINSKLCVTLFTQELAVRLKDTNVVVNTADPGIVVTNIANGYGTIISFMKHLVRHCFPTPKEGAQTAIYLVVDENGKYYKNCRLINPGKNASDKELSRKLWDETVRLVFTKKPYGEVHINMELNQSLGS